MTVYRHILTTANNNNNESNEKKNNHKNSQNAKRKIVSFDAHAERETERK